MRTLSITAGRFVDHWRIIMERKKISISALAASIAVSLFAGTPVAHSGSPELATPSEYRPRQSISYTLGSKFVSGYFLQRSSRCHVTLMVIEKPDLETPLLSTAARIRLILKPGQVAGLDSAEDRSLNVTCGESGDTVNVTVGNWDVMTALQEGATTAELVETR
jgi:hypothetical protein